MEDRGDRDREKRGSERKRERGRDGESITERQRQRPLDKVGFVMWEGGCVTGNHFFTEIFSRDSLFASCGFFSLFSIW